MKLKRVLGTTSLAVLLFSQTIYLQPAAAAALAATSWTLSSNASSAQYVKSTFGFTAPTAFAKSGTVTVQFPTSFVLAAGMAFGDTTLSVGGTAKTMAATASVTAWGVAVTPGAGGKLIFTNCSANACAAGANSAFIINVGDGASGGLNDITNPGTDATYGTVVTLSNTDSGTINTTVSSTLGCTVTNTPAGSSFSFTLAGTAADTAKSSSVAITANATRGYKLAIGLNAAPTHTGYGSVTLLNTWGGTTTTAASWGAGQSGFGYSTDGGVTYKAFDTAGTPVVFSSGATTVGTVTVTVNYKVAAQAGVDAAGIYTASIYFTCTPIY